MSPSLDGVHDAPCLGGGQSPGQDQSDPEPPTNPGEFSMPRLLTIPELPPVSLSGRSAGGGSGR